VLAAYALCCLVASLLNALDARLRAFLGDATVYLAGILLCASFQPKDTILSGAVADVVKQGEKEKAQAFSGLVSVQAVAGLASSLASYVFVRMHMVKYTVPWLGLGGLAVLTLGFLYLCVPETLPGHLHRPISRAMLDPLQTQLEGVRLLIRDRALVQLSAAVFLFWVYLMGFFTTKVSYLITVGYSVEDTVLPEIVFGIAQVFFSATALKLIPVIGTWWSFTLAHTCFFLSFTFWGPYTVLFRGVGPYMGSIFQAAGFTMLWPSLQTIVSQRVESYHQSKCQAALAAIGTSGVVVGVPFYNRVLFSATAEGMDRARTPMASMAFAFVACLIASHLAATAASAKPATASQDDPATEPMTSLEMKLACGPKRPEQHPVQVGYL